MLASARAYDFPQNVQVLVFRWQSLLKSLVAQFLYEFLSKKTGIYASE